MSRRVPLLRRVGGVLAVTLVAACGQDGMISSPDVQPAVDADVESVTPLSTAESFREEVEELLAAGTLNRGQANALLKKLDNAVRQADRGQTDAALAQMEALDEQIQNFVDEGVLSATEGQLLVQSTASIRQELGLGGGVVDVAAGEGFTCAVAGTGEVFCWGSNGFGQLGDGSTTDSDVPVQAATPTDAIFVQVAAGAQHTCALATDGRVFCWGNNSDGQLGDGSTTASSSPVLVSGGVSFVSLDAAHLNTCGGAADGTVYCWGSDGSEQLGAVSSETCLSGDCSTQPLAVSGNYVSVSVGLANACALEADGSAVCWGTEFGGEFGTGTFGAGSPSPTGAYTGFTLDALDAGGAFSCGVASNGDGFCSGFDIAGQLGDGNSTTPSTSVPVAVAGGLSFTSIAANDANSTLNHACGVTTVGDAYCWGNNEHGQLGAVSTETCAFPGTGLSVDCSTVPVSVTGGLSFTRIDVGGAGEPHSCGTATGGDVYCWGANGSGQLGDGTTTDRSTPLLVALP